VCLAWLEGGVAVPWAHSGGRDRPWVWRQSGAWCCPSQSEVAPGQQGVPNVWPAAFCRLIHHDLVSVVQNTLDGTTEVREQHR
jgi:hypothetical protein